jgi:outer membrane protein assembly factor BamB
MKRTLFLIQTLLFTLGIFAQDVNWTHFRGSEMNGHATVDKAPLHWSDSTSVIWKTAVKGLGWSSPVVYDRQVWVTSATKDGKEMFAICYDLYSGKQICDLTVFTPTEIQRIHGTNSYATPTPCIEEGYVYVHFGGFGTACIDTKSFEIVWKRTDMPCEHMQGPASSVILHKDLLIVHLEGTSNPYVAALNKKTGETIWKSIRPSDVYDKVEPVYRKSYQTPIVVRVNNRDLLISNSAQMCFAHDVNTGEVIWTVFYGYDSTVSQPLFYNGLVFVNSGWIFLDNTPFFTRQFAIDPNGIGDVTKTHVKWMYEDLVPQIPTPLIVDGKMYFVHDRGMVSCIDAMTSKPIWKHELDGNFNASPVYAAGNIYFFNVKGGCTIIMPGNEYREIAKNNVNETVKAVPAFTNAGMVLRTEKNLMLIK